MANVPDKRIIHPDPKDLWRRGEPQSVRDAYDAKQGGTK